MKADRVPIRVFGHGDKAMFTHRKLRRDDFTACLGDFGFGYRAVLTTEIHHGGVRAGRHALHAANSARGTVAFVVGRKHAHFQIGHGDFVGDEGDAEGVLVKRGAGVKVFDIDFKPSDGIHAGTPF